jgi:hypothetical protein
MERRQEFLWYGALATMRSVQIADSLVISIGSLQIRLN